MENQLVYKEFVGSINYSEEYKTYFGKIEDINDLVSYEGKSLINLKSAFKEAVTDYLELCAS